MKVAFIGHTYVGEVGREKLYHLRENLEDLLLVTPDRWPGQLFVQKTKKDRKIKHEIFKTIFNKHQKIHIYPLIKFFKVLRRFNPTIIHVEEGTDALVHFQAVLAKKLFLKKAKLISFTWMNFDYLTPFPLNLIEKFNLKNTDLVVCGNLDGKGVIKKRGYNGEIEVLPQLGVNTKDFRKFNVSKLRDRFGIKKEFVIGFIGRIVEEKGLKTLVDALENLEGSWKFLVVGGGPFMNSLQKKLKDKNIFKKTILTGAIRHKKIPKYINCMDALVLPTESYPGIKEQFGQVLIQAMACGVPVIGSRHGEIPNVIGGAGLIFEEKNFVELQEKLYLIINDEILRKSLIQKGKRRVIENYTDEKIAEKTLKFYKELIGD